jgi:hypothetical protein
MAEEKSNLNKKNADKWIKGIKDNMKSKNENGEYTEMANVVATIANWKSREADFNLDS